MTNCTPLWRKAHLQVKMYKAPQLRSTFGSCDVEQNARRCGAKHISKSKCTKDRSFGALLEVAMSKKCTPLCVSPTTPLRYNYNCTTPHYIQIATTLKKHGSNHLSVHQWIRSAIRFSQQQTSPIGFLIFETSAAALCGTTGISAISVSQPVND